MKFFCKLMQIKWGMILITIGGGVILALLLPAELIVVLLSVLLICVGICLLYSDKGRRRF